ncbi:MAG: FkbM family methyltransferase [Gemmatimonadaceae bacterium]
MIDLIALRDTFRAGGLDKHAYARAMAGHHEVLAEYVALLAGSDIDAIEIAADGIWLRSRLAPILFACDPKDRGCPPMVALNFGSYERTEFAQWCALLPKGARIADIGANIGWFAAHSAALDPTASVVAFEPVPTSFEFLSRTIARNGLSSRVTTENLALADHANGLTLIVDRAIPGAASGHPTIALDHAEEIHVCTLTLDAYADAHGLHFDAIKLDVEGGELAVLRGAARVLQTDRPIVFCEMLRRHAKAFGYHPNDIIALMAGHGYRCFSVSDAGLRAFPEMDEHTVETNFFFLHGDAHASRVASAGG